jgi:hypothetical protein
VRYDKKLMCLVKAFDRVMIGKARAEAAAASSWDWGSAAALLQELGGTTPANLWISWKYQKCH